jgi:acetylornithine aminotransferase/acetylornithine/N-succinyldiaminopimelate aminotransferase
MADTRTWLEWSAQYLMNTYARNPLVLVRGEGARVWDSDGKEYLDFVEGFAVNALGHCHPRVVATIREQAGRLIQVSNLYHIASQIELAKLLVEHSFADKVFFCNSGSEANEGAIKLARRCVRESRASDCYEIITMRGSFHGRTLGALAATAQEKYQQGFEPLPTGFKYVPYGNLEAAERAVDNRTCAILVEPIQGEGGVNVPDDEYLPGLRRLCDRSGALLILDEVQTGMGRTGTLWAHQRYGIEPDIMTVAKALAGGVPIGAVLARERVATSFTPGSHGSTFGGNPLATAAGVAAFTTIVEEKVPARAERMGHHFLERLAALQSKYAAINAVRGLGLLVGMELDRPVKEIVAGCREEGLLILTAGDNVLRFLPPLIVEEADLGRAVEILDAVLGRVLS